MNASKAALESKLREWMTEASILGVAQDRLCGFLAQRLVDSGLVNVEEDRDVVLAQIGQDGAYRKVRIVGRHGNTGWLEYRNADGSVGFGICLVRQVHPGDNRKLAEILDRLEGVRA